MTQTPPTVIHVIAAVVDTERVQFYLVDGNTYTMPQMDPRLKDILDKVIPLNARGQIAVVELTTKPTNTFVEAEKTTKGFVKFFKVAREKLTNWLTPTTVPETVVVTEGGVIPDKGSTQAISAVMDARQANQARQTRQQEKTDAKAAEVAKVMQPPVQPKTEDLRPHLIPVVSDQSFDPVTETIVGIVDDTVFADMQQLETMLKNMNQTRKVEGFQNFMTRISAVIKERRHSVEDLIRFLEKADLPLANDGSVIAYKILRSQGNGTFVDYHSGKVKQRVGSLVRVLPELVDLSRDRDCSNGLHIARRSYLRSFGGDVCVLCLIAPEDFMAVPHNDANKVRVSGYRILDVIEPKTVSKIKSDRPGTEDKHFLNQMYKAIHGLYPAPVEEVLITAQMGGGLRITPLRPIPPEPTLPPELARAPAPKALLEENKAFDDPTANHSATNPEFVHTKLDEIQKVADELGEDPEDVAAAVEFHDKLVENGGTNEGMGKMMPEPTPPDSEVAHGGGALSTTQEAPQEAPMTAPTGTYRERFQKLWDAFKAATTPSVQVEAAKAIMALKKEAKKGWDKLNMDPAMVKMIEDTIAGKPPATAPKKPETKVSNTTKTLSSKMGGKKVEVPPEATEGMSKAEKTRYLYDRWNKDNSVQNGEALLAHKKAAKKGWSVLGLTPGEIDTIKMFLENK
jgi:hypothetical protein